MGEPHSSYPVSIRWIGGKAALASTPDAALEIDLASPLQFGGPGERWSPEHLFVAAAASCWMTTFLAVAELSKLDVSDVGISGEGFLEKGEDRRYSIPRILLRPRVTIRREEDRERALRLIQKAEDACLIARSMKTVIELAAEVEINPVP